ncbi:MAG: DoxX family protein [Bacteroidales bacterium]|nr:DoxX family protein [Bacteroidales bacterium]MCF8351499.1 DoxX family protein [Bacteroidales bacterium]MCF8377731.1 DoxX family protein [Bacteroidales bacterium]MCF8402083.1 DoxX family protein [Bacteroidales bacterium]
MHNNNLGLLILRLAVSILLLLHGINKVIHGIGGIENMLAEKGLPAFIAWGVYLGEVITPLLVIIGYRTRLFSLVMVANMLVIMLVFKNDVLFSLAGTGAWKLELQGLYLFGSLALFFTGAGRYAVSRKSWWD